MFRIFRAGLLWFGFLLATRLDGAMPHLPALPWIPEQSAIVFRVDLQAGGLQKLITPHARTPGEKPAAIAGYAAFGRQFMAKANALINAGASDITILEVVGEDSTGWVALVGMNKQASGRAIRETLMPSDERGLRQGEWPAECRPLTENMLAFGAKALLDRLQQSRPEADQRLGEAFSAVAGYPLQVVVRNVATFMQNRPEGLRVTLLADLEPVLPSQQSISWVAVGGTLPELSVSARLQATTESYSASWKAFITAAFREYSTTLTDSQPEFSEFLGKIDVQQDSRGLKLGLDVDQSIEATHALVVATTRAGMQAFTAPRISAISNAIQAYAAAHEKRFPESLADLVTDGLLQPDALRSPVVRGDSVAYVYVPPKRDQATTPGRQLLAYQKFADWGVGIPVAFADGTVRFIARQQEFQELLAEAQQTAR